MRLVLVRHGESDANVAAAEAEIAGSDIIGVPARDADVRLTELGRRQGAALGPQFASWSAVGATVWVSPYARALETAGEAAAAGGVAPTSVVDDRLRDRELGILDALTTHGVEHLLPEEAARRRWLGKYYYRPPGGESWADLGLRLRDALRDIAPAAGPNVVITHDAVILVLTGLLLGWDEARLLEFARENNVANASVTLLEHDGEAWRLMAFAVTDHLASLGVRATEHPGDQDARIH